MLLLKQSGMDLHLVLLLYAGGVWLHPCLLLLDNGRLRDHDRLRLLLCCLRDDVRGLHRSGSGLGLLSEGHHAPC